MSSAVVDLFSAPVSSAVIDVIISSAGVVVVSSAVVVVVSSAVVVVRAI